MAITIRVPDPTEEYDAGNQRQIVRAINNVIQQLNAQYKPQGETFNEIEQLSYFLGNAPAKPSGPATAEIGGGSGGGLPYSRLDATVGVGYPFVAAPSFSLDPNRGYLIDNGYFAPIPPDFLTQETTLFLPTEPPVGSQVGIVINDNLATIQAGLDADGYPVSIDLEGSGYITLGSFPFNARTLVYFGDGGYAYGYKNVWYTISSGYQ